MQARDDYDHALFVHTARGERAFVMDPYRAVVKRGETSRVERVRHATRERALVQDRDAVEALRRAA